MGLFRNYLSLGLSFSPNKLLTPEIFYLSIINEKYCFKSGRNVF
jgi:hypothetical protein